MEINDDGHLPNPKRVQWEKDVQVLGESPPPSPILKNKVQKRPAGCLDQESSDSAEEATPPPKKIQNHKKGTPSKKQMDPSTGWPAPPARRTVGRIKVGDKRWESRWNTSSLLFPEIACHDHFMVKQIGPSPIQMRQPAFRSKQRKKKSVYTVKTKGKWKRLQTNQCLKRFRWQLQQSLVRSEEDDWLERIF